MTTPRVNSVVLGDCLERLRELPACSVDALITDPPYGLGTREPTRAAIAAYLGGASLDTGGDFWGRDWSIPPIAVWEECYRVLKPGAHALVFGGTRTFDLISLGLRAAGFECRDTVASQFGVQALQWIYGQGFPTSLNVTKALEKLGAPADVIERWTGWGTALKPSWEPVLVFRKPLQATTVVSQMLGTGTGAINVAATRVATSEVITSHSRGRNTAYAKFPATKRCEDAGCTTPQDAIQSNPRNERWPANVLLNHASGCALREPDAEVPVYECANGCPVAALDEQSGFSSKTGGASRFYGQFRADAPFIYAGKVSKAERDRGLPKGTNKHPTMKPQALMRWLVKLVTRKGGVILDPFCGSGSTCVAAISEGCQYFAMERDPEFYALAVRRIAAHVRAHAGGHKRAPAMARKCLAAQTQGSGGRYA